MAQSLTASWLSPAAPELMAFLDRHADGFAAIDRLPVYGKQLRPLVVLDKSGEVQAVMLLYEARIRGRQSLSTPPFSPWTGPYVALRAEQPAQRNSELKRILDTFAEALKAEKRPVVNVAVRPQIQDMQPFLWAGFQASPKYSYRIDLTQSEETLFKAIASKRRNTIRQGESLELGSVPSTKQLIPKIREHLTRLNAFHEPQVFNRLFSLRDQPLRSFEICEKGKAVWWLVFLEDGTTVYYLFGGPAEQDVIHPAAGSWGLYQSMLRFKAEGKAVFDFEGSMIPEVESVFRSFGGELITYFSLHFKDRLNKVVDLITP